MRTLQFGGHYTPNTTKRTFKKQSTGYMSKLPKQKYPTLPTPFEQHLRLQEAIVNSDSMCVYRPFKPKGQRRENVRVKRLKNIMQQARYIRKIFDGFWEFRLNSNYSNIHYLKIK